MEGLERGTGRAVDPARLRQFDLFEPLPDRDLAAIARCCQEEPPVPAGTIVLRQGQVAKRLYFLEDGAVNIYRERLDRLQRVALIESPGVFGEMALVNRNQVRTATVRAATDLRLLSMSFVNMIAALRCVPKLREQLRWLLQKRCLGDMATAQPDPAIMDKVEALCR